MSVCAACLSVSPNTAVVRLRGFEFVYVVVICIFIDRFILPLLPFLYRGIPGTPRGGGGGTGIPDSTSHNLPDDDGTVY